MLISVPLFLSLMSIPRCDLRHKKGSGEGGGGGGHEKQKQLETKTEN